MAGLKAVAGTPRICGLALQDAAESDRSAAPPEPARLTEARGCDLRGQTEAGPGPGLGQDWSWPWKRVLVPAAALSPASIRPQDPRE